MTYALWPASQEAYVSASATKTCWKRAIAASPEAVCLDSSLSEATEPDVQLTVFFLRPEAFLASGTISDTDLKFVHLCFEFVQPVVGRSDKFFFSPFSHLTDVCLLSASVFRRLAPFFFFPAAISSFSWLSLWHEASSEWQPECERVNSLSKEIAVPHPWVLAASAVTSLPREGTLSARGILQFASRGPVFIDTQHEGGEQSSFTAPNYCVYSKPFFCARI